MKRRLTIALATLVLTGAGCSAFPSSPASLASTDIMPAPGASFSLEARNIFGFAPSGTTERKVTIDAWREQESARISWSEDVTRETEASKAARSAAESAPVGEEANIPDPVFETITRTGTIATDALNNASRILLPAYWPDGDYDVSGDENSVLWLSRQQYDELASTRTSHIELGLFDSTLKSVTGLGDTVTGAIGVLEGSIETQGETTQKDFTALTAKSDFGSYTLLVNGEKRTVQTLEASNVFASYTILANPENPLLLRVTLRPWALGVTGLATMASLQSTFGYALVSLTSPNNAEE